MSTEKDLIISVLTRAERRIRGNERRRQLARGLAIMLLIPVVFKVIDLITPFRGRTVLVVLLLWAAAVVVYLSRGRTQETPLPDIAGDLDRRIHLQDRLRTAYWFIRNPLDSQWIQTQLQQTAAMAEHIQIDRAFPRQTPRTLYVAAGMIALIGLLNFLPLPWNHNWLLLQAAPAFQLTESQQVLLDKTRALLGQMRHANETAVAAQLEKVIQQLQQGQISVDQALHELAQIQNELQGGGNKLDRAALKRGLESMGQDLAKNEQLEEVARAVVKGDLSQAAKSLRDFSQSFDPGIMQQLEQILRDAAQNIPPGLEDVAQAMKEASEAMKKNDKDSAQQALKKAASALDTLDQELKNQDLKAAAAEQLAQLQESIEQGEPTRPGQQGPRSAANGQEPPQQTGAEAVDPKVSIPESPGMQANAGDEAVDGNSTFNASNVDVNRIGAGGSQPDVPLKAELTTLDVQLVKAGLKGQPDPNIKTDKIEAASKQERSTLDYRNVPSPLTPAQKDSLNQDRVPSKYRPLVKQYFETLSGSSAAQK